MVEDRLTEPTRVAELLASELTGLGTGALADVAVVDADPDASPSPGGTHAYALTLDGRRVGTVSLYPDGVVLALSVEAGTAPEDPPVPVETADGELRMHVEDGVAVKRTVDAVRSTLEDG